MDHMNLGTYLLLVTLGFIVYAECSVGNLLFRVDSSGRIALNLGSLINFMGHPFYNRALWSYRTLDINYPFVVFISVCLYYASSFL